MDGRGIKMNKTIRILAGIGAVALIVFLLVITMALTGNPISKILATRTADKYIAEKYSDLKVHREETYYNFKDGNYGVKYTDRKSKDIHFTIGTDYLGRLSYDGYEKDVLSKWNTRLRLENEYSNYVEKIIRDNLDFNYDMVLPSTFGEEEKDKQISKLKIDMIFDLENIPFEQEITLYIYEENRTWERLAEVILEVNELMEEKNLDISKYTIVLGEPRGNESKVRESLGVYDFPKELLDSSNLPKVLEAFFNKYNE